MSFDEYREATIERMAKAAYEKMISRLPEEYRVLKGTWETENAECKSDWRAAILAALAAEDGL